MKLATPRALSPTRIVRQPQSALKSAADERRDSRPRGHEQICEREAPRRFVRLRCVADHGAREHQPRASAESLEEARHNERMNIRSKEPDDTGDREERKADEKRRPAAKAIRRGPVEQLTDGQSENVQTDGHFHGDRRRMKILGGRGQRRHEYVHADGPAEGEQAQEPKRRNRAPENEFHRAAVRLRWVVSGSALARLPSRSLTVSSRRNERAKSSSDTSPRTRSRMSCDTRST